MEEDPLSTRTGSSSAPVASATYPVQRILRQAQFRRSIRGVCGFDGGVNVEEGDGADDVEEAGYGGGGGGDAQVGALMGGEDPMTPSPTCVFLRQGRIGGAPRSVRTGGSPANAGCAATACSSCSRRSGAVTADRVAWLSAPAWGRGRVQSGAAVSLLAEAGGFRRHPRRTSQFQSWFFGAGRTSLSMTSS